MHIFPAATRTELSRCGVGFAVRTGAPRAGYRHIRSNETGSPESQIDRLREGRRKPPHGGENVRSPRYRHRLETEARFDDRVEGRHGRCCVGSAVVLTLVSALMPVHGIDVVGPLPADLQGYVNFGAVINSKTADADAARALIAQLPGLQIQRCKLAVACRLRSKASGRSGPAHRAELRRAQGRPESAAS